MFMINRDNTSSIALATTAMGILMDSELQLLEVVQGKRVLRSLQLPADVSEPGGLLEYLWDTSHRSRRLGAGPDPIGGSRSSVWVEHCCLRSWSVW
jgi:hypothetical protein